MAEIIIKKKQNCAQKIKSAEFVSRAFPSIMKGAAANSAAPGTGIPLKKPGILLLSRINKTKLRLKFRNLIFSNNLFFFS